MTFGPETHFDQDVPVAAGLYGKHPSFGDFVVSGLSAPLNTLLEQWFAHVMPRLKEGWGDVWEHNFDNAFPLRFWFGPDLTPEGRGFLGVVRASRDKVGRRFPLVAGLEGSPVAAPVSDQTQATYTMLEGALDAYIRPDGSDASAFAAHIAASIPDKGESLPLQTATTGFWAARNDGDIARLWQDAASADYDHAIRGRSYVWRTDDAGSAVYVCQGWPDVTVIAWLMGAALVSVPQDEES